MKMIAVKMLSILVTTVLITQLCACQKSPVENIVTSKNDGAFNINVTQSATVENDPNKTNTICISEEFYSTDNSLHFIIDLNSDILVDKMPVVEVGPHYLTTEDAKRVAEVLFNGSEGFEAQPILAPTYSKPEIQRCLARWSPYASIESVESLLGVKDDFTVEVVKRKLEALTEEYDTAPDTEIRQPCKWEFQKEAYYNFSGEEAVAAESYLDNDMIMATFAIDNIVYDYNVVTRNNTDYKLNDISAHFHVAGSPMSIDAAIYQAQLCRTGKPGKDELSAVKQKAVEMLSNMNLGEWSINHCEIQATVEDMNEYIIYVTAVPVLNGTPALYVPQITNLNSDTAYASNYYITMAEFYFSSDGKLVSFHMASPIDTYRVVNDNVAVMSSEELISKAKNYLALTDVSEYFPSHLIQSGVEMSYTVNINNYEYGLIRIRVPDAEDRYYYVPGIVLKGNLTVESKNDDNLYFSSETPSALIAINAVDGTIIELDNN